MRALGMASRPGLSSSFSRCMLLVLAFFFLALIIPGTESFDIINASNVSDSLMYYPSPRLKYLSPHGHWSYPITGRLVFVDTVYPSASLNLTDSIVLYQIHSAQFKEEAVFIMQQYVLKALIVQTVSQLWHPGLGEWVKDLPTPHKLENDFPVFEITTIMATGLKEWILNSTNTTDGTGSPGLWVSFDTREELNPWQYVYTTVFRTANLVVLVVACFVMVAAVYKLVISILDAGPQLSVAQLVLWFNVFSLLLRILWCVVDPMGSYGIAPNWFVQLGISLPVAPAFASIVLVSLYWHEMLRKTGNGQVNAFLDKMLIPFLVFSALLIAWEITTDLVRGFRVINLGSNLILVVNCLVYIVLILVCSIFFTVTQVRVMCLFSALEKRLEHGSATISEGKRSKQGKNSRRLSRMVANIFCMLFVMVLFIVPLLISMASNYIWVPSGYCLVMQSYVVLTLCLNIFQVNLIHAPNRPWRWIFCGLFVANPSMLLSSSSSSSRYSSITSAALSEQGVTYAV